MTDNTYPTCDLVECFGCEEGHCIILINTNFGDKMCPFFKTREQVEAEKAYCRKRLDDMRKGE